MYDINNYFLLTFHSKMRNNLHEVISPIRSKDPESKLKH